MTATPIRLVITADTTAATAALSRLGAAVMKVGQTTSTATAALEDWARFVEIYNAFRYPLTERVVAAQRHRRHR